ncbi:DoxX family protein [Bordetella genomosp. 9]|uniref:GntR family transcriptional regulator n=1 Tax=Bordetella genomosp. 9 TaxID=1416803 RepID=A0A1W6YZT1_9BORD|nr:DoxX family protein [Bordetella genomosp. 9]ARP86501.1 GntR family transcriptional regulator [Bordetella genomosp. 9]ARP90516.1 GntR family transcriptional regulator [Bordetella genomosp. 9]
MNRHDDAAKLILRLVLGLLILLHGISKMTHGVGNIVGMVQAHGWPAFMAYFVYIGEVVAPILVIAGLFTRLGALLIFINMIVAIVLVHQNQLFMLNGQGGWQLELQGMFLFTALAVALMGAGRFSVGGTSGRFN